MLSGAIRSIGQNSTHRTDGPGQVRDAAGGGDQRHGHCQVVDPVRRFEIELVGGEIGLDRPAHGAADVRRADEDIARQLPDIDAMEPLQAMVARHEQLGANLVFVVADLPAQRRLRRMQSALPSNHQASSFPNSNAIAKMLQLHRKPCPSGMERSLQSLFPYRNKRLHRDHESSRMPRSFGEIQLRTVNNGVIV
jgi:hypothetical protein